MYKDYVKAVTSKYNVFTFQVSNYQDHLVWDKDDDAAMDFVASCSNIRSHVFGISQKTRFDIKSMAGMLWYHLELQVTFLNTLIVMKNLMNEINFFFI